MSWVIKTAVPIRTAVPMKVSGVTMVVAVIMEMMVINKEDRPKSPPGPCIVVPPIIIIRIIIGITGIIGRTGIVRITVIVRCAIIGVVVWVRVHRRVRLRRRVWRRLAGVDGVRSDFRATLEHGREYFVWHPALLQIDDFRRARAIRNCGILDIGFDNLDVDLGVEHLENLLDAGRESWGRRILRRRGNFDCRYRRNFDRR
jgi:hypothetical protein